MAVRARARLRSSRHDNSSQDSRRWCQTKRDTPSSYPSGGAVNGPKIENARIAEVPGCRDAEDHAHEREAGPCTQQETS